MALLSFAPLDFGSINWSYVAWGFLILCVFVGAVIFYLAFHKTVVCNYEGLELKIKNCFFSTEFFICDKLCGIINAEKAFNVNGKMVAKMGEDLIEILISTSKIKRTCSISVNNKVLFPVVQDEQEQIVFAEK